MLRLDTAVASSAAGSAALRTIAPVLNLASSILLARLAGPREFGVYAYCLAMVTLVVQPVTSGLATAVVRHVAAYRARGEWDLLRGTLRRGWQAVMATSVVLVAAGIAIGAVSARIAPESAAAFAVALVLIPLATLSAFRSAVLRGLHHVVWGQVPEQIVAPASILALIVIVAGAGLEVSALTLIVVHVVAIGVAFLVGSAVLANRMPRETANVMPRYEDRYWLSGVLPLMLLGGFQQLSSEIGVVLVGQIDGAATAGMLRLAIRGAELVPFALVAFNMAVGPMFSRLYALNDMAGLSRLAAKTTRVSVLVSLPIALPMIFWGDWMVRVLYGPQFEAVASALAILCIGQLVNVVAGPVGSLLTMTGHERDSVKATFLALTLTVASTALLMPRWGINGAAAGIAIGMAVRNALHCWLVFKRLHIRLSLFG